MTEKERDVSVFTTMERLSKGYDEHDDILEKHSIQLSLQAEQIKQLQDNGMKLENIVMSENRETRLIITQMNDRLHELINGLMGYKTGQNQIMHAEKMARMESIAKIIGLLAGSGGILYYIFGQ